MDFRIRAIGAEPFEALYGAPETVLAARGVRRIHVEESPGYPCRVSLRDAEVGESVLLLNHVHHDVASPYRASHAIFVIEGAQQAHPAANEVPLVLASRLLSVRAFDEAGDMISADVCEGAVLADCIARLGALEGVTELHVHNARPGCYAARVELLR